MLERLLIVGLGSIGRRHLRLAREILPEARIVVLRHRNGSQDHGLQVDGTVTTLEDAVGFGPQAAVIASPASHHLDAALTLADAGAHLLIEKPIASSSHGVAELIEKCRVRGLVLMTGYNLRFLPSLQRFRELLVQGFIGRPLSVRAEAGQYLPSWRPDVDYRQSVSARAALGGGVMLELSHEIDYLRWLFGDVEWVSSIQRKVSDLEIDVEDTAHIVMGFVDSGGAREIVASLDMDFVRHDTTRGCTVIGETGTLRWDAGAGAVHWFEQGGKSWQTMFEQPAARDDSYRAEWREFLRCIADGTDPQPSGGDGLAALRVIDAARLSNKTGSLVRVERDETRVGET